MADESGSGVTQAVLDRTVNAQPNIAQFGSIPYKPYVDNQPVGAKLKEAFAHFLSTPEGQRISGGSRPAPNPASYPAMFKGAPTQPTAPPTAQDDPRNEGAQMGAQAGSGMEIRNFDNMGTYARAVQLAQLMGVPAFTFQGKLYRPGDTQAPVSAAPQSAPQMRLPGGMPQEAGPRQAPPMDRREPELPIPASAAPAPAPAAAPQPDYSNLERGGGGGR